MKKSKFRRPIVIFVLDKIGTATILQNLKHILEKLDIELDKK